MILNAVELLGALAMFNNCKVVSLLIINNG